ncbi:MAG: L-lysine 2,3-aminomutase [Planctomycetota bacterium]
MPRGETGLVAAEPGDGSAPWQGILARAVRDPALLLARLGLDPGLLPGSRAAAADFPCLVPEGYLARMRPGDPRDPLLLQVLPHGTELAPQPAGYGLDPLAETGCSPLPGFLHKYQGRALLVTTGACAVHCRFCFRRHFPYDELPRGRQWWAPALERIAADATLHEILLSGGDPLTLPDAVLGRIAADLAAVPHLRRIRIHTRLPIVLPERVDGRLLAWLAGSRLQAVVVVHANHPQEIDASVAAALGRLRGAGITVLNQSTILAGVNDDVMVLAELSERLFAAGALPYYLHAFDPVAGAAHFAVDDGRARTIHRALQARLPGYLVPRLVREIPGEPGKTPL